MKEDRIIPNGSLISWGLWHVNIREQRNIVKRRKKKQFYYSKLHFISYPDAFGGVKRAPLAGEKVLFCFFEMKLWAQKKVLSKDQKWNSPLNEQTLLPELWVCMAERERNKATRVDPVESQRNGIKIFSENIFERKIRVIYPRQCLLVQYLDSGKKAERETRQPHKPFLVRLFLLRQIKRD